MGRRRGVKEDAGRRDGERDRGGNLVLFVILQYRQACLANSGKPLAGAYPLQGAGIGRTLGGLSIPTCSAEGTPPTGTRHARTTTSSSSCQVRALPRSSCPLS